MERYTEGMYQSSKGMLHYYEVKNDKPPLVLVHAQGTNGLSFEELFRPLAERYHIFAVDCFGHGGSEHRRSIYTMPAIGQAVAELIRDLLGGSATLCGHSSGGLVCAWIAAYTDACTKLFLEDPPLFSSQGERRKQAFNYRDLSSVCHKWVRTGLKGDFVLYYFANQKAWEFFPEKSREKTRTFSIKSAAAYRARHPKGGLKVTFWPKSALAPFSGMDNYDPWFGETFYTDSFHAGIDHGAMLRAIRCETVLMKAETKYGDDGLLLAAMSEEDCAAARALLTDGTVVHFACGHGIHHEKKQAFLECLLKR